MKNRDLPYFSRLAAVFILALALSSSASAQSGKVYRIGLLELTPESANRRNMDALLRGLREAGFVEDRNIVLDYRSVSGRAEGFRDLAAELVRAKPDIIMTRTAPAALAAKAASATIPIVMTSSADPVAAGVVTNLAHPGGMVTGMTTMVGELYGKRLEILKDFLPSGRRIGVLLDWSNPTSPRNWQRAQDAARSLAVQVVNIDVRDTQTLQRSLDGALAQGVAALLVGGDAAQTGNRDALIAFAAAHKLPAMYAASEFVHAGGLISYGVDYPQMYYRAAGYAARILRGAKPGDLPIEQPTNLLLVINMKTAKAAGIEIPKQLLLRADEVIQ